MNYGYHVRAKQHGQLREEACTSASETLDWVDRLIEQGWKKITIFDEQGTMVTILTAQAKAAEEGSIRRTSTDGSA